MINIDKLEHYNWIWYSTYDYECSDCDNSAFCESDGICRCKKITSTIVTNIDIDGIANNICNKKADPILRYAVNRILCNSEMNDVDNWYLDVVSGYYGEEIDGIKFDGVVPKNELNMLLTQQDKPLEIIKTALMYEYNYILPEVEKVNNVCIATVPLTSIIIGQDEHYQNLNEEAVRRYEGFTLPRGICLAKDDKFRLIDGYHRIAAAKMKKNVKIIVLS